MNAESPPGDGPRWKPSARPTTNPQPGGADTHRTVRQLSQDVAHLALVAQGIVARGEERFFEGSEDGEILRRAGRNLVTEFWAAVERLPVEAIAAHPEIPVDKIRGMRNRVAHRYENVDDEYIWAALKGRFHEIADSLAEYRQEEQTP